MAGRNTYPSTPKKNVHEMNADALFKRQDRFSKDWFAVYDDPRSTSKQTQNAFVTKVVKEMRKSGKPSFTSDAAKAGIIGARIRVTGSARPAARPAATPAARPAARSAARSAAKPSVTASPKAEVTDDEVKRECALFKRSIDELVTTHPTLIRLRNFPELEKKYQNRFFEEKNRIKSIVDSECFYGRKPDRKILVDMNNLISQIHDEMETSKKGGKKTRKHRRKGIKRSKRETRSKRTKRSKNKTRRK